MYNRTTNNPDNRAEPGIDWTSEMQMLYDIEVENLQSRGKSVKK